MSNRISERNANPSYNNDEQYGKQGFWEGEVRNIEDNGSGKVQVRIYGEEDDLQSIPDQQLRYAEVGYPVTTGQVPGSSTMHGLMVGSRVMGIFAGGNRQTPIVTMVLSKPNKQKENA